MKSTGIVRKVDELGRVVIPIELRRNLGINEKDPLEIYIDDNKVVLKKHVPNEELMRHIRALDDAKMRLNAAQKERIEQVINYISK
ncbi:AbrB/MazE/SpoVT family DNA-binding domain-containing protein [Halobacillus salinus]|uniref:AbrB/MazE/SpoVT family DNA-binding domain-containing protein n=1 Tax=Halobacillus salinus TaxID=192814 RepID=UPI0009A58A26|nr:AbrB/MazE/SpoVT family DNA-binding domain-containing protein [Halobacillus salinus]